MATRRTARAGLLAIGLAGWLVGVALAGCGTTTPSPSAPPPSGTATPASTLPTASPAPSSPGTSGDVDAVYAEIEAQVVEERGLEPKRPVEPRIVSREEIGQLLRTSLDEDVPADQLAAFERLYRGMGLMPAGTDLATVYGDLLESQVGGLYVPADETLYVVSKEGELGPIERVLFSHEFTHALQDQHFDLEAIQEDATDQTDRQLARQALIEGDAYVSNTRWMLRHLTPVELGTVIQESSDPEALAALDRIPPIVQSAILFAATQGTKWVLQIQGRGGWDAVNAVWARPPDTTEQVLHPEKYDANERPIAVTIPDDLATDLGAGWSLLLEDTFGEHQLGIWLSGTDAPSGIVSTLPAAAAAAAQGWGGDRVALLAGPDGATAIVLRTEWDTAADAGEFTERASAVIADFGLSGLVGRQPDSTEATVLLGSDDDVVLALDLVLGLTGV